MPHPNALRGIHVVLTRAQPDGLAARLAVLGATVQHLPAIQRSPLPHAPLCWDGVSALLLTSPATPAHLQLDRLPPARCRVACVGPSTARAAAQIGLIASTIGDGTGADCVRSMGLTAQDVVLFPGPRAPRCATIDAIHATGAELRQVAVYETTPHPGLFAGLRDAGRASVIVFASPSAARCWAAAGGPVRPVLSIGPSTTDAARTAGFLEVKTAGASSLDGLTEALCRWAQDGQLRV